MLIILKEQVKEEKTNSADHRLVLKSMFKDKVIIVQKFQTNSSF